MKKTKRTRKTVFIDTNIFLHYKFFTDINWMEVLIANEILIVIPPIVMREIEKHKFNNKDQIIKKRSEKISARFAKIFKLNEEIRPDVKMLFEAHEPDEEFSAFRLSRETQDDHLIASMLLYKRENPEEEVVLVTNDLPLQVKIAPFNVEIYDLPESLQLPPESDPNEKKVKALERQIRELTHRIPNPKLVFGNGQKKLEFQIPNGKNIVFLATERAERIEEIKKKYPKMEILNNPDEIPYSIDNSEHLFINVNLNAIDQPHPRDIEKYNNELDLFYNSYEEYLTKLDKATELNSRKMELDFQIINEGTASTEEMTVFIKIPIDQQIITSEKMFKFPKKPNPPEKPKPRQFDLIDFIDPFSRNQDRFLITPNKSSGYSEVPNIRKNNFTQDNFFYHVSFKIRKAIQGLSYSCPYDIFLVFNTLEEAKSFQIKYSIVAANLPQTVNGTLNIVVKK